MNSQKLYEKMLSRDVITGTWQVARDMSRSLAYVTPAVRAYDFFYLNLTSVTTSIAFRVLACRDALVLLTDQVQN